MPCNDVIETHLPWRWAGGENPTHDPTHDLIRAVSCFDMSCAGNASQRRPAVADSRTNRLIRVRSCKGIRPATLSTQNPRWKADCVANKLIPQSTPARLQHVVDGAEFRKRCGGTNCLAEAGALPPFSHLTIDFPINADGRLDAEPTSQQAARLHTHHTGHHVWEVPLG